MVAMVEASANVGLEERPDLLRDAGPSQRPQGLVRASSRPKSVRALAEVALAHRFEEPRHRPLDEAVCDRGNTQRPGADLAGSLRDGHAANRWCPIGPR